LNGEELELRNTIRKAGVAGKRERTAGNAGWGMVEQRARLNIKMAIRCRAHIGGSDSQEFDQTKHSELALKRCVLCGRKALGSTSKQRTTVAMTDQPR
jgi:hypothetical protein